MACYRSNTFVWVISGFVNNNTTCVCHTTLCWTLDKIDTTGFSWDCSVFFFSFFLRLIPVFIMSVAYPVKVHIEFSLYTLVYKNFLHSPLTKPCMQLLEHTHTDTNVYKVYFMQEIRWLWGATYGTWVHGCVSLSCNCPWLVGLHSMRLIEQLYTGTLDIHCMCQ